MATPEGRIKAKVDRVLKRLGVWYFNPQSGIYGSSGIPDKIACVNGQLIGIEVKSGPTKKPTRLQLRCMTLIEEAGGKCFVVCDDDTITEMEIYIKETLDG